MPDDGRWQPGQSGNPAGPSRYPKIWKDAINRAIKRREADDPRALEKIADRLIEAVLAGDVPAMKEFGDRVDGKVPQAIVGDNNYDAVRVEFIKRIIVDPKLADGDVEDSHSESVPAVVGASQV